MVPRYCVRGMDRSRSGPGQALLGVTESEGAHCQYHTDASPRHRAPRQAHRHRQRHARGAVRGARADARRAAGRWWRGREFWRRATCMASRWWRCCRASARWPRQRRRRARSSASGSRRIVFTGVAGGLGAGVKVGDVVVADSFLQHDLDASPIFPKYEVPLYGTDRFPTDPRADATQLAARCRAEALPGVTRASRPGGQRRPLRCHHGGKPRAAAGTAARRWRSRWKARPSRRCATTTACRSPRVRTMSDRADDAAHADFSRLRAAKSPAAIRRARRLPPCSALPQPAALAEVPHRHQRAGDHQHQRVRIAPSAQRCSSGMNCRFMP